MAVRTSFFFLLLIAMTYSCKKDECENYLPHKDVVIDNSMNTFKFKESSYWVYQNDVTLELDSQRVIFGSYNDFTGEFPNKCSGGTSVHEYRMTVHSFLNNQDDDYFIIGSGLTKDTNSTGNHYGRFIYSGTNIYSADSGSECIENIPLLNLNGNDFYNVKKIWVKVLPANSYSPNLSIHDMYYYFSDSVGLIKWELSDGSSIIESWSLKSWDVIL
jgi:hypothetical protein